MRIVEISAHPISVRMPESAEPVTLGIGRQVKRDAVLVRVATEDGIVGWGESHAGRAPGAVTLIAISKIQPIERVEAVLTEGHRVFGENRVQEAQGKWPALREKFDGVALHLVGPLQTNKARQAMELCDVIHSVDRPKLATTLARLSEESNAASAEVIRYRERVNGAESEIVVVERVVAGQEESLRTIETERAELTERASSAATDAAAQEEQLVTLRDEEEALEESLTLWRGQTVIDHPREALTLSSLGELAERYAEGARGEVCLLVEGAPLRATDPETIDASIRRQLRAGASARDVAASVAAEHGALVDGGQKR